MRPLAGIRVIDLSMGWAGPLAARHLADLGAEVIKVESCERFDWWRGWEATEAWIAQNAAELSPSFNTVNRNKLDVTLDLTSADGAALLKRLVAIADVVVENYSAGVLPKLGLDYAELAKANPQIVMLSMPAFGTTGPWAGYRAYGSTVEHASGLPHLTGEPHWPPAMSHVAYGDAVGGLTGAAALLTALRHRKRTGEGQFLDLSQSEGLFPLGAHGILEQAVTGKAPQRMGNRSATCSPHGVYPTRGDDQWLVLQVLTDEQWRALCEIAPTLRSFGDVADRLARRDALDAAVAAWTRAEDYRELMHRLQGARIPAAAVYDMRDVLADPQLAARGFWQMTERAYVGVQPGPAPPYRSADAPYRIETPAPTLGQHNRRVLGELLGLDAAELERLARDGVIGDRPVMPKGE
ncbi:MAG TPA: CoA transferase [Pseudomonadales bacterium]|nr:CoA transferase [Pseudomonadales bacterium]